MKTKTLPPVNLVRQGRDANLVVTASYIREEAEL
jgi:hypothetical protein